MEIESVEYQKRDGLMMDIRSSRYVINFTKTTVFYLFAFIATAFLAVWLFTIIVNDSLLNGVAKGLFVLFFLLAGTLHIFIFPKCLPLLQQRDTKVALQYSILLSVLMGLCTLLVFLFIGFAPILLSVSAACGFLLPAGIVRSWISFNAISGESYKIWFLSPAEPPKKMIAELLNDVEITIKLKLYYFDTAEVSFTEILPGRLELGKAFQSFISGKEQTNTRIQLLDHQLQPYAWKFLLLKPLGNRLLDPEANLISNKIRSKDTILVQRIKINRPNLI